VRLEHKTLKLLKYWTWQFVVVRPVCSILIIALQLLGLYPSWVSWTFTIILNFSVSMALYALVIFYHLFAKELAPHKPLAKFLCIKGIVFFSFWQGLCVGCFGWCRGHSISPFLAGRGAHPGGNPECVDYPGNGHFLSSPAVRVSRCSVQWR
uniref:Uncharacterized protein n=1 Tax=Aegilops tauschii subsp. strangulata TaxID=200361 RepID=A0A453BFM7_AEGTS